MKVYLYMSKYVYLCVVKSKHFYFSISSVFYQDQDLYYLRKPANVHSTRGNERSFLDLLGSGEYEHWLAHAYYEGYCESMKTHFHQYIEQLGLQKITHVHSVVNTLLHTFSREQEYGLLNRLDSPTTGFLYFAKDIHRYIDYKLYQKQDRLVKHYIAKVDGHVAYLLDHGHEHDEIEIEENCIHIHYPIMHHQHIDSRMVVLRTPEEISKGRSNPLFKTTTIQPIAYNIKENNTLLHVTIHAGARHQIRAHLGAIGYPIIGERVYTKKKDYHHLPLHLWSMGCELYGG